jgi:hypothetical protein
VTSAGIRIQLHAAALAAAVAMLLALVPVAGAAERTGSDSVGFGVAPLRLDIETPPGSTTTHRITITNTDSSATRFTFSKEDFAGDREDPGATPVLLGGKFNSSISGFDWIQLPDAVSVPAGQSRSVAVRVSAPAGATGGHYAALMVTGEARSAGHILATSRLGVLFLMNAGGVPPPEIVITEVREVGPTRTVTRFRNDGQTTIRRPGGTITRTPVRPGGETPTRRIDGECTENVLPGAAGECIFDDAKKGSDGAFLGNGPVEQFVDIVGDPDEEGTSARGELPTEWASAWTSLLLPLVGVALFILYFLFLRRRRKNDDGDGDELAWSGPGVS